MAARTRREDPGIIHNLIELLAQVCDEKNLRVTISNSLQGGLLTGICSIIGGLLLGRQGVLAGGIIGGIASLGVLEDFKPVSQVLREMNADQKEKLLQKIKHTCSGIGLLEISTIMAAILSRADVKDLALREVSNYISRDLGLSIMP